MATLALKGTMHSLLRAAAGLADQLFEGYPAPTLIADGDHRLLAATRAARAMPGPDAGAEATSCC